jgi:hypothetical protein
VFHIQYNYGCLIRNVPTGEVVEKFCKRVVHNIIYFPAWIEAKLMRESFSDILMRKIDSTV